MKYAFKKGYGQVKEKDTKEVKAKLMQALGIKTRSAWLARLRGEVEPKMSEGKKIEKIFAEYKIKNVWGD
jgi:hypothetical protein